MIIRGSTTMKKPLAVLITAFSLSLGLTPAFIGISGNLIIEAEAHQGRTDANGGHHDYKNKSGLGSYHYHCGGNPAHLHPNGVCPYAGGSSGNSGSAGGSSSKIRLLPEIKIKQKQQPLRFLLVGRKMIMAGGTAFLQIPTMLTV